MRIKLLFKFILIYVLIALATFVLISTVGSRLVERHVLYQESRRLYREASQIAGAQSDRILRDEDSLRALHESLRSLSTYQGCEIMLLGADGTIYLDSKSSWTPDETTRIDGFDPIALGSGYYTVGNFFRFFSEDHMTVMVPIASSLSVRGYVAVHAPMSDLYTMRERILGVVHLICWIVFGLSLLVLVLVAAGVLRPLHRIARGADEFATGDLDYRISVKSRDELGDLASSLNNMASEMKRTREYQHTFLANVSHDFRSPLTSIKGYLEAIQDGTIPQEMQNKYIGTVLSETERLTKLTNGILTLNNMDSRGQFLSLSNFDIHAVIRDTVSAFEGICIPRQISIELLLADEELLVSADMGKIQQVLYNLIDNAIKFSRDNSSIQVETNLRNEKVYVSVKDHGAGIPSHQISKIWDRFYKADSSRGRERKGNGLGLSIVKEIIKEHGQNISVVSTEGVGTEFTFSLVLAEETS